MIAFRSQKNAWTGYLQQNMDDLPVGHPGPFSIKITLSCKTWDFYLKLLLLLLLENVKHNQSLMQHCPLKAEDGGFPNFTSEAGSYFFFKMPIPATLGHDWQHQLSQAYGNRTLPHWMVFRQQSSSLEGLALTDDCGTYHLKVSVSGGQCAAFFTLHILNPTVTEKDQARDTLSCSEGEMTIWANLLLQLNPTTLDASQRIRLVSITADYLHLPLGFVYLFSRRKSIIEQQEKLRVCQQGGKQDAPGDVAELLWPVGCQREGRQSDLAKVLEYSVRTGGLARLLEAPVVGWKVLCGTRRDRHNRDLQRLKFTPTPNMIVPPPTQVHQTLKPEHSHIRSLPSTKPEPSLLNVLMLVNQIETRPAPTHTEDATEGTNHYMQQLQLSPSSLFSIGQTTLYPYSEQVDAVLEHQVFTGKIILTSLHTSVCVDFGCSSPKQEQHKAINQAASRTKPLLEVTGWREKISEITSQSISGCFTFLLPFLPEYMSTVRTSVAAGTILSTLLASSTLHSVYSAVPLTSASYGVTSTLTHEAADRKSLTTGLTLRPHQKETPLWTGSYRAGLTDSESQSTVSSLGHIIYNPGPIRDHTDTLYNLPSASHPPPTENDMHVPLLNSTSKRQHSLPPSNKTSSTWLFPNVSPPSNLMTERISITQHSYTVKHLSSVLNQDLKSKLNVTTQGTSATTLPGQLTLSGQTELESSLSTTLFESSVATFTPALPSELGFFSEQHETPSITNPVFTGESVKLASSFMMPLVLTFSKSLLPDFAVSSLQDNIERPDISNLMSISDTGLYLLHSDISFMSLQPTSLQMSRSLTKIHSVTLSTFKDEPFEEQPSDSAHESVQQTLQTLQLGESLQIDSFHPMSVVTGTSTAMNLNTAAGPSVTFPLPLSASQHTQPVSDPTAPSAVQELYATSFIHQMHSLDPSFPLCGQSVSQDHVSGCTAQIKSTNIENTDKHVLDSQDKTAFLSQFFMFDSGGYFFSTQTSRKYLSMHPFPSVLSELASSEFMSLLLVSMMHLYATMEIDHTTATPQMDISLTLPALEGFSVITYTSYALDTFALIRQSSATDSCEPITKERLTWMIRSTSLSQLYGTSTAFLPSSQAGGFSSCRRESSVHSTFSSSSISSTLNLPPKVMQSIPALTATVGLPFHFSIPPKTFIDPEDGDAHTLSLEIRLIDGPPVSVGTWLSLDGLELHGVPLEVDLQFAPQHLLLAAQDRQGLSTWLPLTLDLRRSAADPCHIFTLTAQRSLHSVLRQRRRVELLLRKLSRFFNSSSSRHLSVVSMRPGSTVVSWYNYSLCGAGHTRVKRCRVDQIQSMWQAMTAADGSVSPAFREVMLPEFPITKVGPVSFRRDCFSTTSTPIFDGSSPAVHTTPTPNLGTNTSLSPTSKTCVSKSPAITASSQQITDYEWMAGMFTALLVVCLLILIVLLIAVVLYFCKGHSRSRTVAIWPASRVLSLHSSNLRAIRPRRPPLFQPELPPPPLRLWISLSQDNEGQPPSTQERGIKTADRALQPRPPFSRI